MSKRRLLFGLLFFLSLLTLEGFGQRMGGRMSGRDGGADNSPVYFESLEMPGDIIGKVRVDVLYRISYDFFIFVRDTNVNPQYPYFARGEIAVEMLDSAGNSVSRRIVQTGMEGNEPRSAESEKQFTQGILSFQLSPGMYTVHFEVTDKESNRKYTQDKKSTRIRNLSNRSLALSDVLFSGEMMNKDTIAELVPMNFGGDIPLGRNFDAFVLVASSVPADSMTISYHLLRSTREKYPDITLLTDSNQSQQASIYNTVSPEAVDNKAIYRLSRSGEQPIHGFLMKITGDSLEEGEYQLKLRVKAGLNIDTLTRKFRIRWFDMPVSLRNQDIVDRVMGIVMADSEYSKYKSLGKSERMKKFHDYWKRRDPTPATAYNEALAECFKRVDYAIAEYSTISEPEGYRLDRGKAYIVYGSPSSTDRNLTPNSVPQEIWYYPNLHKKLTFVDSSRKGEYKLISIEEY